MTIASSSPPTRRPRAREDEGDGRLAAVFIAPALLGFLVFLLWPTLRGIYLSFTRFNLLTPRSGWASTTTTGWSTTPSSGRR